MPPHQEPPLVRHAADPEPRSKRAKPSPAACLTARRAKAARNVKLFNLLKAGVPIAEIALQEGLWSAPREVVQEILARREVDPSAGSCSCRSADLTTP